jgi:hypothetical protein
MSNRYINIHNAIIIIVSLLRKMYKINCIMEPKSSMSSEIIMVVFRT